MNVLGGEHLEIERMSRIYQVKSGVNKTGEGYSGVGEGVEMGESNSGEGR